MRKWMMVLVLGLLSTSVAALAETVTLTFEGATGPSGGGEPAYPYNMQVTGQPGTVAMACDTYSYHISNNETWTANVLLVNNLTATTAATTLFGNPSSSLYLGSSVNYVTLYQDAAWLFLQLGKNSSADALGINFAIWQLLYPSTPSYGSNSTTDPTTSAYWINQLKTANLSISGEFNGLAIYTPLTWTGQQTGSNANEPQEFIGPAPVPEPGTLALLGTGLVSLAGFIRKRYS